MPHYDSEGLAAPPDPADPLQMAVQQFVAAVQSGGGMLPTSAVFRPDPPAAKEPNE